MSTFQVSPGVNFSEIDLTTIVPSVSSTEGALVGQYRWGPLNQRVLVTDEDQYVKRFWKPNSTIASSWFTGANFFQYATALWVVRVGDEENANTNLRVKNASCINSHGFLVKNDDDYISNYNGNQLQTSYNTGPFVARYAGDIGNSLKVSVCSTANTYQSTLTGTVSITANSATVTGSGTSFVTQVSIGDLLVVKAETHKVQSITNSTSLILKERHIAGANASSTAVRRWEFFGNVDRAPGTSPFASVRNGLYDEMHIAVVDEDGEFTGQANAVLEIWQSVSKAADALKEDGTTNYYKNVINHQSQYLRQAGQPASVTNAGSNAKGTNFGGTYHPINYSLVGGTDGTAIGDTQRIRGYNLFKNPQDVDVSLVLGADADQTIAVHLMNNIAEARKDCIVLLSPPQSTVVNNVGNEAVDQITFRNNLPSSSYAVMDDTWKYMYDKYNDVYRYVPMNGDIGGLIAQTDVIRDPWWSPAGFQRGNVKGVVKLSYNASSKAERDLLFKAGINPVVTFPTGEGTVLFGDKTMLARPSAFDAINVRRLFIVLEKAISIAARQMLFEFNDEFTRSQFKSMVEPYLRTIQGRRGITAFRVVCDNSNNTPEVIDRNAFVGDIYIKPARAIRNIQLNFVAVRSGVDFQEITGNFGL